MVKVFALLFLAAGALASVTASASEWPNKPVKPCVDILEPLERELRTFVISSLQASLWNGLELCGYRHGTEGYGRLLRDLG